MNPTDPTDLGPTDVDPQDLDPVDLDPGLRAAIAAVAGLDRLLVASDFDGVLAPLVDDPSTSRAIPGTLEALDALSQLPGTTCAVVSGRDLETLLALTGLDGHERIAAVGSHGAQSTTDDTSTQALTPEQADQLAVLDAELSEVLARHPGVRIEHKPAGVVLHTRGLDPTVAEEATAEALVVGAEQRPAKVLRGKDVVEMSVVDANKGTALLELAAARGSQATVYLGDDVTDEQAFERLGPHDLTIKVGPGPTAARFRVTDATEVLEVLEQLLSARGGH